MRLRRTNHVIIICWVEKVCNFFQSNNTLLKVYSNIRSLFHKQLRRENFSGNVLYRIFEPLQVHCKCLFPCTPLLLHAM